MNLNIKLLEGGKLPIKATEEAGAYDVYVREITKTKSYVKVKLGFKTKIPKGFKAILIARSSISDTGWILCNSLGLIDSDFLGEWQMRFTQPYTTENTDRRPGGVVEAKYMRGEFPYKIGDRCGQFFLQKVEEFNFNIVEELETTDRGEGGFGSTKLN